MKNQGIGNMPISKADLAGFQHYIFTLSAVFIAIPAEKIPDEITRRIKEIGDFGWFDQIILCRYMENDSVLSTLYAYYTEGCKAPPCSTETSSIPWLNNALLEGRPITMARVLDELPENACTDRIKAEHLGIKSAIILPFIVGGLVQGGLFFNSISTHRTWPQDLVRAMQHISQILAGAIERLKTFNRLQHAMRFDRLLSETSATYINLPSKDIVRHIQTDLGQLGSCLKVDRCLFYLADKNGVFKINENFIWWNNDDFEHIQYVRSYIKSNPCYLNQFSYIFKKWNQGKVIRFSRLDELPPEADEIKPIFKIFGTQSWLSVPVSVCGDIMGALVIASTHSQYVWPEDLIPRIRLFGEIFANAIKRIEHEQTLEKAFVEIKKLKQQIEADYVYLRDELTREHHFKDIIGESGALKNVLFKVGQVAPTDASVLILGETGTGKEVIARAIHNASQRRDRPLIKVNCATLTPNLIESELFGHEKGAFTGADKQRIGRFELADGATLFLDEVGELPLELQPKLLRVLQEGEFERLGGSHTHRVDVRIIAATNRNLEKEIEGGRFRSDLWYRLNSFPIIIPPLRERKEDIPLFVTHFVNQYCAKIGKRFDKISRKMAQKLTHYSWPGNIRELDNIISQAVIISEEGNLQISIPSSSKKKDACHKSFREMEKTMIMDALEDCGWKIEGRNGASAKLSLKPSTLRNKMKKLGITRPA